MSTNSTIDPSCEELISLSMASKLPELRRNGKPISVSTVWRWALAGRLETIRGIGGGRLTSVAAVKRAMARQNPGKLPAVTPAERTRRLAAAEHRLEKAGI